TLLGPPAVVAAGLDVLPQAASRSIAASGTATRRATRLWMRRFMCRPPPFCSHELYTGLYTKPNGACRAVSLRVLAASDRAGVLHAPLAPLLQEPHHRAGGGRPGLLDTGWRDPGHPARLDGLWRRRRAFRSSPVNTWWR